MERPLTGSEPGLAGLRTELLRPLEEDHGRVGLLPARIARIVVSMGCSIVVRTGRTGMNKTKMVQNAAKPKSVQKRTVKRV